MENADAFSVAGLLYPSELRDNIWRKAKRLGDELQKTDFKHSHVADSKVRHEMFVDILHTEEKLKVYAFYIGATGMAHEIDRSLAAQRSYEGGIPDFEYTATTANIVKTEPLFDQFIGYMVSQIGRYAIHHNLEINLFWDDRTDINFIANKMSHYIDKYLVFPHLKNIDRHLVFKGSTTDKLNQIARLSDVLAGDVRTFFKINGKRIWSRLDPSGLYGVFNPWQIIAGSPLVATIDEPLSVENHDTACMLPKYYKLFLADQARRHLIRFVDPRGRAGFVAIERENRWHVLQHPD